MISRLRFCTPCNRNCKEPRPNRKTPINPELSVGLVGPSPASAAGPDTQVTDLQVRSRCEMGCNDFTVWWPAMNSVPIRGSDLKKCVPKLAQREREQAEFADRSSAQPRNAT